MNYAEVRGYRGLWWVYANDELDRIFETREEAWAYAKATYPHYYLCVKY